MRVFVVGTGRCGTSTFRHAASLALNKSVRQESAYWNGVSHREYLDGCIEIGHQLTWVLSYLLHRYRDSKIVHLVRDKESCVRSLQKNGLGTIPSWYNMLYAGCHENGNPCPPCSDLFDIYYDQVNFSIPNVTPTHRYFRLKLEAAKEQWRACWDWMSCEGDFERSLACWAKKYNQDGCGSDGYLPDAAE